MVSKDSENSNHHHELNERETKGKMTRWFWLGFGFGVGHRRVIDTKNISKYSGINYITRSEKIPLNISEGFSSRPVVHELFCCHHFVNDSFKVRSRIRTLNKIESFVSLLRTIVVELPFTA